MSGVSSGLAAALLLLGASLANAQQGSTTSESVGVLEDPCAVLAPMPPEVRKFRADVAGAKARQSAMPALTPTFLAIHAEWQRKLLLQDFAGLCRYRDDNAGLPPATAHRVVLFGDSITELWGTADADFFTDDKVNRGISGQTTAQMVARFQHDAIALRPRVVHILAGINDIAGNTGPTTLQWIQANIRTMVELARANRIEVVLATVLPAERFNWRPSIQPVQHVKALNAWIKSYAESQKLVFVDYGRVLDNGSDGLKAELTTDGVHPNPAGYARMRPLAERAIRDALLRQIP